jgi:hypothetical protein
VRGDGERSDDPGNVRCVLSRREFGRFRWGIVERLVDIKSA